MCRFKSFFVLLINCLLLGFNTSYVSVQGLPLQVLYVPSTVSIHPMCRFKLVCCLVDIVVFCFNTSYVSVQVAEEITKSIRRMFQYILCVGSRKYRR